MSVTREDGIKVRLPKRRIAELKQIAQQRNQKQRRFGAMTYGGGRITRGSLEAHLIGMVAEVASAYYYGVDVDRRIFHNHGDDGEDLTLPLYGTTQVKSTTYWSDPWLRAEMEHDHEGIQTYMLVCVDTDDYTNVRLVGQMPREEVIQLPQKRCKIGGPYNYVGSMADLHPLYRPSKSLVMIEFAQAIRENNKYLKSLLFKRILERASDQDDFVKFMRTHEKINLQSILERMSHDHINESPKVSMA